jgi:DNA-binding HxlR family transcriptional regulator
VSTSFDREKIVDCMFDPITSSILAHLEDGEKHCSFLAHETSLTEIEVLERLSYLIEHDFVKKQTFGNKSILSANVEKLTTIVEDNQNFDDAVSGLEKLDSYLN